MQTHTIVNSKSRSQVKQPQTWDKPTALAQVRDEIRASFTPVMQVVEREVLADGRVRLLVKPVFASTFEEWVLDPESVVEQQPITASSETTANKQPAGLAGDSVADRLQPDWEAIAEYSSGCTHGKHHAASRMPPICQEANCPYSQGYLNGYSSILFDSHSAPPTPKAVEWKVVYDPKWNLYQVWIGDRCLLEKAISYLEGERIAQKYMAAEELRRQQRELVVSAFAS